MWVAAPACCGLDGHPRLAGDGDRSIPRGDRHGIGAREPGWHRSVSVCGDLFGFEPDAPFDLGFDRAASTHSYAVIRSARRRSRRTCWRRRVCSCSNIGADATAWTGDRSDHDGDHPKTSPGSLDPNSSCNDSTRRTSRRRCRSGRPSVAPHTGSGCGRKPISVRAVVSTRTERRCVDDARQTRGWMPWAMPAGGEAHRAAGSMSSG